MAEHRPRFAIIGSRGYPSTYGGFETLVRHLAPYLAKEGYAVTVYGRGGQYGSRSHGPVEVVYTPGLDARSTSTLTYGLTASLHAVSRRFDAALVLNVANGFFLPALAARGVPTAVNVDGIEWERAKWNRMGKTVFKLGAALTARFADRIIVDSVAIGDHWAQQFGVASTFIPYGASVLPDTPATRLQDFGLAPGEYVLAVARLAPENNVDLLLDAGDLLNWSIPVVVVGSATGPSATEQRLRRLQDTTANLRWLGHVGDQGLLNELWQHCGIYIHGHSVGGTNPALLQALGAGSPTVVLRTPYNTEVVGSDWPAFDAKATDLAHLIDTLMRDSQWREEAREAGRRIVNDSYSWPAVLESYRDVLSGLAAART